MGAPLVTLTDIKTALGKTGTDDDLLIASIASNATAQAENDTSRIFSVTSNVAHTYSTDGSAVVEILDRPRSDATRTMTLYGAALNETGTGANVWLLPDRRNQDVSIAVQVRPFDTSSADWYKGDPQWFDKNLDRRRYTNGMPNDLVITGTVGHPVLDKGVFAGVLELACWMYWRAKGGVSSYASTLSGTEVDLANLPELYQVMVDGWKVRPHVAAV